MDTSFSQIEKMLSLRMQKDNSFPYQEVLLTRLCMFMQSKLLDKRNKLLTSNGINETLFMTLMTLDTPDNESLKPSQLSAALGLSRTNITRTCDTLMERGWITRDVSKNDRRSFNIFLTEEGRSFLYSLLPQQHDELIKIWSVLNSEEKNGYEKLVRKLLIFLDQSDDIN